MNKRLRNSLINGNISGLLFIYASSLTYRGRLSDALYYIKDDDATIKGLSQNLFSTNIITTRGTQTITNTPMVIAILVICINIIILLSSMIWSKFQKKRPNTVETKEFIEQL